MKRNALIAAVLALAVAVGGAPAAQAKSASKPASKSSYIVKFSGSATAADEVRIKKGKSKKSFKKAFRGAVLSLTAAEAAALAKDPDIAFIERDGIARAAATQTSPTWGLDRIDQARNPLSGTFTYPASAAAGVTAYVLDTGVTANHNQLLGRVKPGFNAVGDTLGTADCNGHGTHVAGTLAGTTHGVAKAASVVPVRVLDCAAAAPWSTVISGIEWAITHHVAGVPAVANLSISGSANAAVEVALANLIADGVTVVVAAGNSGADACNYSPGRAAALITVGATNATDSRAAFSNFGTCLDIFAPGEGITSAAHTILNGTRVMSGTSMAAPHVAGAAALLLAANPTWTHAQVSASLTASATSGVVLAAGAGTPNRMLNIGPAAPAASTKTKAPKVR